MAGLAASGTATTSKAGGHQGYVVPAEEAPHEFCLMQWPVHRRVYRDREFRAYVQETILEIANTIAEFEPVVMCADASHHGTLRRRLSRRVTLWDIPTDDLWARDSGPIVARNANGARAVRHIQFNGWGEEQDAPNDKRVAEYFAEAMDFPLLPSPLKGEAGGVEQNGEGLLIAHESSWVDRRRNPGMTRDQIGAALCNAYGADRIIWAPGVANLDITDYHIDGLLRFVGRDRVLMSLPDDPDPRDPFHRSALETYDILEAARLRIDEVSDANEPRSPSRDFVASYANYYVANGAVIMPQFGDRETDTFARAALQRYYPNREIVTLNADALGELGGGIHCATHEIPA